MSAAELDAIDVRARASGATRSAVVRRALRDALARERMSRSSWNFVTAIRFGE
jgi:metal-responsive CopG/Arc/MetJ family transcriptional regulator